MNALSFITYSSLSDDVNVLPLNFNNSSNELSITLNKYSIKDVEFDILSD